MSCRFKILNIYIKNSTTTYIWKIQVEWLKRVKIFVLAPFVKKTISPLQGRFQTYTIQFCNLQVHSYSYFGSDPIQNSLENFIFLLIFRENYLQYRAYSKHLQYSFGIYQSQTTLIPTVTRLMSFLNFQKFSFSGLIPESTSPRLLSPWR